MNIICVDASRISLFGLQRRTKSIVSRASVYTCQNADQAAKLARENGCDVLLTDIALVMADVSGEGAIEAMFGEKRLLDAVNELGGAAPEKLLPHIRARIDAFVNGGEQFDDITMLGLRYKG